MATLDTPTCSTFSERFSGSLSPKPNECLHFDLESCNLMCTYTVVTHPCHIPPLAQARPMMLCIYTSINILALAFACVCVRLRSSAFVRVRLRSSACVYHRSFASACVRPRLRACVYVRLRASAFVCAQQIKRPDASGSQKFLRPKASYVQGLSGCTILKT